MSCDVSFLVVIPKHGFSICRITIAAASFPRTSIGGSTVRIPCGRNAVSSEWSNPEIRSFAIGIPLRIIPRMNTPAQKSFRQQSASGAFSGDRKHS